MNDDEEYDDSLDSQRESSSFGLSIKMASSRAEVGRILYEYGLSDDEFTNRFPSLAKLIQGLPEETAPPA